MLMVLPMTNPVITAKTLRNMGFIRLGFDKGS
jgi:hypothetical protein